MKDSPSPPECHLMIMILTMFIMKNSLNLDACKLGYRKIITHPNISDSTDLDQNYLDSGSEIVEKLSVSITS